MIEWSLPSVMEEDMNSGAWMVKICVEESVHSSKFKNIVIESWIDSSRMNKLLEWVKLFSKSAPIIVETYQYYTLLLLFSECWNYENGFVDFNISTTLKFCNPYTMPLLELKLICVLLLLYAFSLCKTSFFSKLLFQT